MRNLTKALTVVSLLAPVSGHTLGIGDISVRSALNQNLNAEIALVAARGEKPSNIKVSLAPAEKFDAAGVPWSYFLSKLRFTPVVKPNGTMVIKVTSKEALKEPYLNFLLEVSWPKGNLYREFTVLVDPPTEYQAQAFQKPVYQQPDYAVSSSYDAAPMQQQEDRPRRKPVRHRAATPRTVAAGRYGGEIVTHRNDTLWNVAARVRGAGVSVEQMMMALYNKNPQAFFQQNVNALAAGQTLKIPEKATVQQSSRQEAMTEFARHNEAWNNNRSGVPSTGAQVAREDTVDSQLKLEAPAEATVAANESVSPSSEQTTDGNGAASKQPNTATNSEAQKPAAEPQGAAAIDPILQSKIADLEKQMATMKQLIELKDKQLADLQNPAQTSNAEPAQPAVPIPPVTPTQPAKPVEVTPAPVAVTPPPTTQQVAPVKPVPVQPKPIVKPVVKPIEPVTPTEETPWGIVLGGLGVGIASLFGWLWWRKQKIQKETDEESMFRNYTTMKRGDSVGSLSTTFKKASGAAGATGAESSFLNDFKSSDFETFESFNVDHSDIDPVAEADVYLAYGRFQQAEDLLKDAIKENPERDDCKLKLLEIYQASSNKDGFESYATELVKAGKKENIGFWGKVVELSRGISSDNELFSMQAQSSVAVFPTESADLNESILFSSMVDQSSEMGAANFEIPDDNSAGLLFDAPHDADVVHETFQEQTQELTKQADISPDSDENITKTDALDAEGDGSLDFDLGPYPIEDKKVEEGLSFPGAASGFGAASVHEVADKAEIEAYEFDFSSNVTAEEPISKPEKSPPSDSWDASQTLDFSSDGSVGIDTLADDAMEFNFDLELPTDGEKHGGKDFAVSDLTDMDEMETKLDLAKAYIDMGDTGSAQDIIEQVIESGSAEQKKEAQQLLDELNMG